MAGLRAIFAGERGRLLAGLMFAEFGTAIQVAAQAAVLPLAARDLHGASLYGAATAGPVFASILFVILGPTLGRRVGAARSLGLSTVAYLAGVVIVCLAPAMWWVLVGRVIQGAAAGLLAGLGMAAIGALYDDTVRSRVIGLFGVVWLLPSVLGPAVNGLVATFAGWRWALAWPAIVVIAGRLLIGRRASMLPVDRGGGTPFVAGLVSLAGLALAACAPGLGVLAVPVWLVGLVVAVVAGARLLMALSGRVSRRFWVLVAFAGVAGAYFGGETMLALGVIDVQAGGPIGSAIAYGAGAAAWSVVALRSGGRVGRRTTVGSVLILVGLVAVGCAVLFASGVVGVLGSTVGWTSAGIGMGLAYPALSSGAFDGEGGDPTALGSATAFAESAGAALGQLVGAGFYSIAVASIPPAAAITTADWIVAAAGVLAVAAALRAARPLPNSGVDA